MKDNFVKMVILFGIFTLFFSIGYSALVEDLTISGIANLENSHNNNEISSGDLILTYEKSMWYSGGIYYYQFDMNLKNVSPDDIKDWKIMIDVPNDAKVVNDWSQTAVINNSKINISSPLIQTGEIQKFGFQISMSNENYDFSNIIINGTKLTYDENEDEVSDLGLVKMTNSGSWQSGKKYYYQYDVIFTNKCDYNIKSWEFSVLFADEIKINQLWGANYINDGKQVVFSNVNYNGNISAGKSISFGVIIESDYPNIRMNVKNVSVGV